MYIFACNDAGEYSKTVLFRVLQFAVEHVYIQRVHVEFVRHAENDTVAVKE